MDVREQFRHFRATHQVHRRIVAGHQWTYVASGTGDQTLVILPGGGASAECMFPLILEFEKRFRVLSMGCPATVTTVDQVVAGLKALLDQLDVRNCTLLGHSLGAMFAACFAVTHPAMVRAVILANAANYSPLRARLRTAVLWFAQLLPGAVLASWLRAQFTVFLKNHPERDFWLAYFNGHELATIGSAGIKNRAACLRDFMRNRNILAAQLKRYSGRLLIIESADETRFTCGERQALRRLCSNAAVHTFSRAGHLSFAWQPREFAEAVRDFMLTPNPSAGLP